MYCSFMEFTTHKVCRQAQYAEKSYFKWTGICGFYLINFRIMNQNLNMIQNTKGQTL